MEYKANITESIDPQKCPFCQKLASGSPEVVKEFEYFFVMPNIFPYIENHIMVMPKRHVHSELDFTQEEQVELNHIHRYLLTRFYDTFGSCFHFARENTPGQTQWHYHRHYVPHESTIIPKAPRIPFAGLSISI